MLCRKIPYFFCMHLCFYHFINTQKSDIGHKFFITSFVRSHFGIMTMTTKFSKQSGTKFINKVSNVYMGIPKNHKELFELGNNDLITSWRPLSSTSNLIYKIPYLKMGELIIYSVTRIINQNLYNLFI